MQHVTSTRVVLVGDMFKIAGVFKRGEHAIIAGHVLRATAIKYPIFSTGFVVHLYK